MALAVFPSPTALTAPGSACVLRFSSRSRTFSSRSMTYMGFIPEAEDGVLTSGTLAPLDFRSLLLDEVVVVEVEVTEMVCMSE